MGDSAKILSTGNINIYANSGTNSNGIGMNDDTRIRSTAGDVFINAIGVRGVWGIGENSQSIRAYGDLTIHALASTYHAIYSDATNVTCTAGDVCGWVSDTGNIVIKAINSAVYDYASYLRNPIIANGTGDGKGNITYLAVSKQGGIQFDYDYGYIKAQGDINIIAYSGESGGNAINVTQEGPALTASDGGLIRSIAGDITFSVYSANNAGVYFANNDNIRIVALAGDIIMQGASLSTNTNDVYNTSNTCSDAFPLKI